MLAEIFGLLFVFQAKHLLADYPLQTPYMLQKFRADWGFMAPLAAHAGVHALMTGLIAVTFQIIHTGSANYLFALVLAGLDFTIHFAMDRLKAGPRYLGRYKALTASEFTQATPAQKRSNRYFWWALGLDQTVHHLTHYWIIYLLVC